MSFMPLQIPHALASHLSPTLISVERTAKCWASVVQTVPSVYGLAPRDYRHTSLGSMRLLTNYSSMVINSELLCNSCRMNSYIRNGWASNIINPDKTMHSASVPSLSGVTCTSISTNEAAEILWTDKLPLLMAKTYFVSRTGNNRLPAVDFI